MKTSSTALLILLVSIFYSSHATNYTNNGTSQAYSLIYGDTLRVATGTYRGNLNVFTYGAVIIVSPGATFKPNNMNMPSGKILNYGTCEFGSIGTYSNFRFENFNLVTVNGNLSLYDGSTQTWTNNVAATMRITGNFSMNNAVFTNYASVTVGGNFAMYTATSNYINRGLVTIAGDLSINNGILNNQNRIITDDLNAWGGQVINEGSISPNGNMTFSNGTSYTNRCLLVTNRGFTNYGNFTNNGMLWVGRTGTANDHFYNSGTFTNSADAVVRTVRLTNYSALAGGGSYYITGESLTSGTVGRSGTTTDSIKVYDVTRASSSRIFDTQWGTVHPNVVYRSFAQPDTNAVNYTGCSSYYRMDLATILPVEWNYFDAKPVQNLPVLSWSAQFEPAMKFEVERSTDNANFRTITTVYSNTARTYSYTDAAVEKGSILYYRIKATSANGAVKYTEIKTVKIAGTIGTSLSLYPSPVKDAASIQYKAEKSEPLMVRVSNAGGQQMLMKNVMAVKGTNTFSLSEAAHLKEGIYFVELINSNAIIATERFIKN